jgi:hypothetical protein
VILRNDLGQVEQRPGQSGYGDAVDTGDVPRIERADGVQVDPGSSSASATCNRDVDPASRVGADARQPRGAAVAEHRIGAAREHGGHHHSAPLELAVAYRVDAPVHAVQPSQRQPSLERSPPNPALA